MNLEQIESLLKLMTEYQVASIEVESEGERVKVDFVSTAPAVMAPAHMVAAPAGAPASAAPVQEGEIIKSPMVGTFYSAPKPGSPPFVSVGTRIAEGDVLCIIEAMKLFNELECEISGTIAEVLVENAQLVQFGQPLFRVVPG